MSPSLRQQVLRKIPRVDEILSRPQIVDLLKVHPRNVVIEAIRKGLGRLRGEILQKQDLSQLEDAFFSFENLYPLFQKEINLQIQPRLRRVINATGVVIHTNLGRAPLHSSAIKHLMEVSKTYSNLEYDLDRGERGDRYTHVEEILCRLSGAESALVVNNNAGAVLLALNTLAEGKEVIVSRGELVEIGGAFRIPDFGEIIIEYCPGKLCIELKSLKFYMQSYRNKGIFYEALTNDILDDLSGLCKPRWMKVVSRFTPRGGITTEVTAEYRTEK